MEGFACMDRVPASCYTPFKYGTGLQLDSQRQSSTTKLTAFRALQLPMMGPPKTYSFCIASASQSILRCTAWPHTKTRC